MTQLLDIAKEISNIKTDWKTHLSNIIKEDKITNANSKCIESL